MLGGRANNFGFRLLVTRRRWVDDEIMTLSPDRLERRHDYPSFGQAAYARLIHKRPRDAVIRALELCHAIEISPSLNQKKLEEAFRAVLRTHPELRSQITVSPAETVRVEWADLDRFNVDAVPGDELSREDLLALVRARALRGWTSLDEPLVRLTAFNTENSTVLLIEMHHVVVDGWSAELIFRDLMRFYMDLPYGRTSSVTYEDFVDWEADFTISEEGEQQRTYWLQQLKNFGPPLALPYDRKWTSGGVSTGGVHYFSAQREQVDAVKASAAKMGVTIFAILLAGWALTLSRFCSAGDIPLHVPVARRARPELNELVGFLASNHCVRIGVEPYQPASSLIRQAATQLRRMLENQDYPVWAINDVERRYEYLGDNSSSYRQVVVSMLTPNRNDPLGLGSLVQDVAGGGVALGKYQAKVIQIPPGFSVASRDLWIQMAFSSDKLTGCARFNGDIFDAATIATISQDYITTTCKMAREV